MGFDVFHKQMLTNHCANPEYWHRPTKPSTGQIHLISETSFYATAVVIFLALYIYLSFGEDLALSQQLTIGSEHFS